MHVANLLDKESDLASLAKKLRSDPDLPFPVLSAKVKLTWRCNLRCQLCRLWQNHEIYSRTDSLNFEVVCRVLTTLHKQGLRKIHFSGGEVLLLKRFPKIVRFARDLDLQVNLTTNGTLLDKEMARFLVDHRVHAVTISIDSAEEKQHDKMRGQKGAWREAWRGIGHLIRRRERKGRGPLVAVNTIITRENLATLDTLYQMLQELGVDRWRLLPVDTQKSRLRPTEEDWRRLAERFKTWQGYLSRMPIEWSSEKSAKKASKGKYAGRFYRDRICFAPWFNLFIDADGKVYPCCTGKSSMRPYGNILQSPIEVILGSVQRREVCCSMASGHPFDICDTCDDFLEENAAFHELYRKEGKNHV